MSYLSESLCASGLVLYRVYIYLNCLMWTYWIHVHRENMYSWSFPSTFLTPATVCMCSYSVCLLTKNNLLFIRCKIAFKYMIWCAKFLDTCHTQKGGWSDTKSKNMAVTCVKFTIIVNDNNLFTYMFNVELSITLSKCTCTSKNTRR